MSDDRPHPSEFPDFYGGYVNLVPDGPILERMKAELGEAVAFLQGIDGDLAGHRYAPGKWSVREVVGHVADTEQVMAFRALHFARSDPKPLPGFAEDDYVAAARFDDESLPQLIDRLAWLRRSSIALFQGFDDEIMMRTGRASGGEFTVRSIAWIIVGHLEHHLRVLRDRYLS